jgi:hypothetical protein
MARGWVAAAGFAPNSTNAAENIQAQAAGRRPSDVRRLVAEAPRQLMAPLTAFTGACRAEREQILHGLTASALGAGTI